MSDKLFAGRSLVFFGALLLMGLGVLSVFAALDRQNRAELETLREPSAVGDPVVYTLPEGGAPPQTPLLQIKGEPMVADGVVKRVDGMMYKDGTDDEGKIPLYRRMRGGALQRQYYIKLGQGQFLELQAASKVKPPKPPKPPEPESAMPAVPAVPATEPTPEEAAAAPAPVAPVVEEKAPEAPEPLS